MKTGNKDTLSTSPLLEGSIGHHLFNLALPNMGGMLAIILFNFTDTFFVSRLGDDALAAMGFTFPVVMIVGAISTGISAGAGSLLARAMGSGDRKMMRRISSDGILLSGLIVMVLSAAGLLTMEPLFTALGAEGTVLELVIEYMTVWYSGVIFVVMPVLSDGSMRAIGDMKRPLVVMLTVAGFNVILDPILIFGLFGFPQLGIRGAALATIIARAIGAVVSLCFVHFRYRLISFRYESAAELWHSWKSILYLGLPGALIRLIPNLVRTLLTRMAAWTGGSVAVAAIAAGSRIEGFAMVLTMAVGVSLIPLVGQNSGAGRYDRVQQIRKLLMRISAMVAAVLLVLSVLFGRRAAGVFSQTSEIQVLAGNYLIIMMAGLFGLNSYNWLSEGLTALGRPRLALKINNYGTLLLLLPAVFAGAMLFGFSGMLIFLSSAQVVLGLIAYRVSQNEYRGVTQS